MADDRGTSGEPGAKGTGSGGTGGAGGTGGVGAQGPAGERGRRGATGARETSWSELVRTFWLLIITIAVVVTIVRGQNEAATRADQNCNIFEGQHLATVNRLKNTYSYLQGLTSEQKAEPLNRLVRAQLPQTEREAHIDPAPDYCDKPGRGLPEPDPVVPDRPKGL